MIAAQGGQAALDGSWLIAAAFAVFFAGEIIFHFRRSRDWRKVAERQRRGRRSW